MTIAPENGKVDAEIEQPKQKHPTFVQNLSKYFTEYCDNTGIHGFKYIGEPGRSIFERSPLRISSKKMLINFYILGFGG